MQTTISADDKKYPECNGLGWMATPACFYAIFTKRDNFCDLMFAALYKKRLFQNLLRKLMKELTLTRDKSFL